LVTDGVIKGAVILKIDLGLDAMQGGERGLRVKINGQNAVSGQG